jgi:hypothetical protein
MNTVTEFVESVRHLTLAEQREVLSRLWAEQTKRNANETWKTIKFSENLRVVAYEPKQENYVKSLRHELQDGVLARLENEADSTFEIYGRDRTYYVTMAFSREFVGLLDSWQPERPPKEINTQRQC